MYKCLNFEIEFPFEQRSVLYEYNIECLLCPRNEKIGSDVKQKKTECIEHFFLEARKVINNIIVKTPITFSDLQSE